MARELSKNMQPHKAKTREKVTSRAPAPKADTQINARTISFSRAELFCAGIVFLVALLLYGWTLAPTVTLTDSGELIVVARGLGIAHPPVVCCASGGRGFAHGLLTHSLVVRDDHRGLCSEYAAHPRYLLSNASMAATYRRRQDAYRHGDQCWRNHFADYKL